MGNGDFIFFILRRRPPRATRTDTRFPDTTLCRSRTGRRRPRGGGARRHARAHRVRVDADRRPPRAARPVSAGRLALRGGLLPDDADALVARSEEHTSELQSLMRISYAVFCLTQNITHYIIYNHTTVTTTYEH